MVFFIPTVFSYRRINASFSAFLPLLFILLLLSAVRPNPARKPNAVSASRAKLSVGGGPVPNYEIVIGKSGLCTLNETG